MTMLKKTAVKRSIQDDLNSANARADAKADGLLMRFVASKWTAAILIFAAAVGFAFFLIGIL